MQQNFRAPPMFKATSALLNRDMIRFYRDRTRWIGAFLTPLLFWVMLGFGFNKNFSAPAASSVGYLEYFFPGMVMMVVLFTAIFSMISLIEDKNEGFMQAVLVSPVSSFSIVAGKVLGAALLSTMQAAILLCFAPKAGIALNVWVFVSTLFWVFVFSIELGLIGFSLSWISKSVQGFHVFMNLILMPLWLLSGATFPTSGVPLVLKVIMALNPLTYAVGLLRQNLYQDDLTALGVPPYVLSMGVSVGFIILFLVIALKLTGKKVKG